MRPYFFLILFILLLNSETGFSEIPPPPNQPDPQLEHPAIPISRDLAKQIFINTDRTVINCPSLFDNTLIVPNAYSTLLCNDAQLACWRMGLLVQRIKTATGAYREKLKKNLILERTSAESRLRGCALAIAGTISGERSLNSASGYPSDTYGPRAQ